MTLTVVPRKKADEREPISHDVEPHNRPYDSNRLPESTKGKVLTDAERRAAWSRMFVEAGAHLQQLDAQSAVNYMVQLGSTMLECYLIAEEAGQARSQVLSMFPKPSTSARHKFVAPKARRAKKAKTPPQVIEEVTVAVAAEADGQE